MININNKPIKTIVENYLSTNMINNKILKIKFKINKLLLK